MVVFLPNLAPRIILVPLPIFTFFLIWVVLWRLPSSIAAAILIVFPLVGLASHKILSPKSALFAPIYSDRTASPDSFNYIGPKPDIYYIIMDGYLRKDVMTEFWDLTILHLQTS